MQNQNILCCLNENPIFSYQPIGIVNGANFQQIIINYITDNFHGKRMFWKEKSHVDNVEFVYYEINLEHALRKVKTRKKYSYNSIEEFCLSFLNYFLEDSPKKLLDFLKSTANFNDDDLKEIEMEFQKVHS